MVVTSQVTFRTFSLVFSTNSRSCSFWCSKQQHVTFTMKQQLQNPFDASVSWNAWTVSQSHVSDFGEGHVTALRTCLLQHKSSTQNRYNVMSLFGVSADMRADKLLQTWDLYLRRWCCTQNYKKTTKQCWRYVKYINTLCCRSVSWSWHADKQWDVKIFWLYIFPSFPPAMSCRPWSHSPAQSCCKSPLYLAVQLISGCVQSQFSVHPC